MLGIGNLAKLVVAVIGLFPHPVLADEDVDARLAREAKAILDIEIGDKAKFFEMPRARCSMRPAWPAASDGESDSLQIPDDLAREYLGLRIHGTLIPPVVEPSQQELLDPENKYAQAFCSKEESAAYIKEHKQRIESGKDSDYGMSGTTFGFPVFDDNFENAIVIVVQSIGRFKGNIWSSYVNCYAKVYRKTDGSWRLMKWEQTCTT